MREIRTSGSEGGVGSIPHSYLYRWGEALPSRWRPGEMTREVSTDGRLRRASPYRGSSRRISSQVGARQMLNKVPDLPS
jgi:hypothetical protein